MAAISQLTQASPHSTARTGGADSTDTSNPSSDVPRPRRHADIPKPKPAPEYVTVHINPEDGKLATQWTPQYIEKTYVKGTEPHKYSRMYQPPPGEH